MSECEGVPHKPGWEDVGRLPEEWALYQELIENISPDIQVKDYVIGREWVFLEAECGCGLAMATKGGTGNFDLGAKPLYMSLRDVACLSTSWNFLEASVGVAALNAWYSTPKNAAALGMKIEEKGSNDGFELYRSVCAGKNVTVVGHFPLIERLANECNLTVLERVPQPGDMPDPACEFVIPHQDYVFLTGVTITNKTLPRLLQLSQGVQGGVVMVGPSVVSSPVLFEHGVDCLAGSVVTDPERARSAVEHGATKEIFGRGVQKMRIERPGWLVAGRI